MSIAAKTSADANLAVILGESEAVPKWLRTIDRIAVKAGDSINPILVKETRQALKSRQFVVTFSLLLFAALAWSIAGTLLLMPRIYFLPSAPTLLTGYYIVLAVPMLLVVPLAAYRSLEGEIDDGTLELLSVTSLSPRQIVMGKLGSAALQMMLYFVALFPCVAYAYTLRGVDLPTLGLLMGMLVVAGLTLTVIAIFFAPMARVRSSQVGTLLMVMLVLIAGEVAVGSLAINLIQSGNPFTPQQTGFFAVTALAFCVTIAAVFVMATAAQLTPESENRSTAIRVTLLVHEVALIAVASYSLVLGFDVAILTIWAVTMHLCVMWIASGAMMSAEAATMTPRIRRELPATFLGRLFLIWFTPGPATGYVFAGANLAVTLCVMVLLFEEAIRLPDAASIIWPTQVARTTLAVAISYFFVAAAGVRVIVGLLRRRNTVRVALGLAAMAVVLLLMSLVPYSIGLHYNDYRPYSYSIRQVTNWVWTIQLAVRAQLPVIEFWTVVAMGVLAFFGHLLLLGRTVLPQRLATPQRVLEERARMSGVELKSAVPNDPFMFKDEVLHDAPPS